MAYFWQGFLGLRLGAEPPHLGGDRPIRARAGPCSAHRDPGGTVSGAGRVIRSAKRSAQEARPGKTVAPGMLDRPCNPDPHTYGDLGDVGTPRKGKWRPIQSRSVVL